MQRRLKRIQSTMLFLEPFIALSHLLLYTLGRNSVFDLLLYRKNNILHQTKFLTNSSNLCLIYHTIIIKKYFRIIYFFSYLQRLGSDAIQLFTVSEINRFFKIKSSFYFDHLILLIEINFNCFFEEYKMYSASLNELYNQYMHFEQQFKLFELIII